MSGLGIDFGAAPRGELFALTPARIADTRTGLGVPAGPVGPGATIDVVVVGVGGVPTDRAAGVLLNVTVTEPTAGSFLTVFPAGQPLPATSTVNFAANRTAANLTISPIGANGRVSAYNNSGTCHVVIDVVGWISSVGVGGGGGGSRYRAVTPQRVLDTRPVNAPLVPNETRPLVIGGTAGVPRDATAVAMNLTATGATAGTFLTAFPFGEPLPLASNVNVDPGRTVANLAIVKLGSGAVSFFNLAGAVHLIADVVGYFVDDYSSGRGMLAPVTPTRVLDTRAIASPLGPEEIGSLAYLSGDIEAMVLNVTVTQPTAAGYLTVFPDDGADELPLSSTLNFAAGATVANLTVVSPVGGAVGFYSELGTVHVIADLVALVTR